MNRGPARLGASARSLIAATGVTVSDETPDKKIARAKGYPYRRPSSSFLFVNGKAYTFEDSSWNGVQNLRNLVVTGEDNEAQMSGTLLDSFGISQFASLNPADWTQVLAIGSNASPQQLARKFPMDLFPEGYVIPTVRGVLSDFDVVYAPLVSSYGSCTATLEYSPGTACEVFVSFMGQPQMDRMNETEGAYNLCKLRSIVLDIGVGLETWRNSRKGVQELIEVLQFNHQCGTLHMPASNGQESPIALKEISAMSRKFPERSQVEMLQLLLKTCPWGQPESDLSMVGTPSNGDDERSLNLWISANLGDSKQRMKIVQWLLDRSKAFMHEDTEVVLRLGNQFSANVK